MENTTINKSNVLKGNFLTTVYSARLADALPMADTDDDKKLSFEESMNTLVDISRISKDDLAIACRKSNPALDELIKDFHWAAMLAVSQGKLTEVVVPNQPRFCKSVSALEV